MNHFSRLEVFYIVHTVLLKGGWMTMKQHMNHKFYQKNITSLYIIILTLATIFSLYVPNHEPVNAEEQLIIPDEAIRLRILANSNSDRDQQVKRDIRDAVNNEITLWVGELTSIEDARDTITSRLQEIETIVENELVKHQLNYSFQVEFDDVKFPTKLYGQYLYPAGMYEAILITLGEGEGENWWCVLFPPLCFLEFSNGLAVGPGFEDEESDEVDEVTEDVEENDEVDEVTEDVEKNDEVDEVTEDVEENKGVDGVTEDVEKNENDEDSTTTTFLTEEDDEVEVKFFIKELFDQLF